MSDRKKGHCAGAARRTLTLQEAADILDVAGSTIQRWVALGCPCAKGKSRSAGNRFDVAEVAAWKKANVGDGESDQVTAELRALKARKERALIERFERENQVAAGLLVNAQTEQDRDLAKIAAVRNRLCGLGAALSPQLEGLDGPARQSLIDQAVESLCREFAGESNAAVMDPARATGVATAKPSAAVAVDRAKPIPARHRRR